MSWDVLNGDCLKILKSMESESVDMVMTSPPYWALRDYEVDGQLGREKTPEEYIENLCNIFDEVFRVLKKTGTCFVNIGDTYGGTGDKMKKGSDPMFTKSRNGQIESSNKNQKKKCLLQIPSKFGIEMVERGWILRNEIIWHKPNALPSSAKDRFSVDFEKIFFFVKDQKYDFETQYEEAKKAGLKNSTWLDGYDSETNSKNKKKHSVRAKRSGTKNPDYINPLGRIKRTVWSISTRPSRGPHVAPYPEDICVTPILAGCPVNGIVLDPFVGSGTTIVVAKKLGRNGIGIELCAETCEYAKTRIKNVPIPLF